MRTLPSALGVLLSICLSICLSACGGESGQDAPKTASAPPTAAKAPTPTPSAGDGATETKSAPPVEAADEPAPIDLPQATTAMAGKAKAAGHLGYKLAPLANLRSIQASASVPAWGSPGEGAPAAARDDDLHTAWRCTAGDKPCALGLTLADGAKVRALRLYLAAGPNWNDYRASPRPKKIRIHTDAGYADVALDDGAKHHYVLLDPPVSTATLTVEVLESNKGKKDASLFFGEVEAIGEGAARPALDLDPARAFVHYETEAWKAKGNGDHTIRLAFVEQLAETPTEDKMSSRIVRGTALLGKRGDRFLLFEKLYGSACDAHEGSYVLLDQHTRLTIPVNLRGALPARVHRHDAGLGFAFVHPGDDPMDIAAIVLEDDELKMLRPRKKDTDPDAVLAGWGFGPDSALSREGTKLPETPAGCEAATKRAELLAGALGPEADPADAAGFVYCKLPGDKTAVVGARAECGNHWSVAIVDDKADFRGDKDDRLHAKTPDGARGIHLAKVPAGWLVELSKSAGASADLYLLQDTGLTLVAKGAGLVVRAPAACDPCDDRFDRSTPVASATPSPLPGVADEGDGDGGDADDADDADDGDGDDADDDADDDDDAGDGDGDGDDDGDGDGEQ